MIRLITPRRIIFGCRSPTSLPPRTLFIHRVDLIRGDIRDEYYGVYSISLLLEACDCGLLAATLESCIVCLATVRVQASNLKPQDIKLLDPTK